MSGKVPNRSVGCDVKTCAFHCDDCDNCSLEGIQVCACQNCRSGRAEDESSCGSYRAK